MCSQVCRELFVRQPRLFFSVTGSSGTKTGFLSHWCPSMSVKLTLHLTSMCPQCLFNHMRYAMISPTARDMRRLFHLKGVPFWEHDCTGGLEHQLCHVSLVPLTCLAWLDRSFSINRGFGGRQLGAVQKPVAHRVFRRSTKTVQVARFRASSSRRLAPAESESFPEICSPVSDASCGGVFEKCDKFPEPGDAGTSGCASSRPVRWQRGGQPHQRRKRACRSSHGQSLDNDTTACALWVDHLMCGDGKLEESLLKRRAVRAIAGRQSRRTVLGKFFKCVKERVLHLVEDVEVNDGRVAYPNDCWLCPGSSTSPWFSVSCCLDKSLAVIQPLWV